MKMVAADVTKVLAPAAKMVEYGSIVVFDENGSYVVHKKTGLKTPIGKWNVRDRHMGGEIARCIEHRDHQNRVI